MTPASPRMPGGPLFGCWFAFCVLLSLGFLSFLGWLAYLLVMHFTHGGAS